MKRSFWVSRVKQSFWVFLLASGLAFSMATTAAAEGLDQAHAAVSGIATEYEAAYQQHQDALKEMRESQAYKDAHAARDWDKVTELTNAIRDPFREEWSDRVMEAGASFKDTESELVFAQFLLEKWLAKEPGVMIKKMVDAHVESQHLALIAPHFRYAGRSIENSDFRAMLKSVIKKNPVDETKAHALLARATSIEYDRKASDKDKATAVDDRAKVVALMPEDSLLSMRARGPAFQRERLQIGMEVPDIVGEDIDGVEFKLSDYRGKVIVLDFWGDW